MILLGVNIDHCATLRQARYREAPATAAGPPSVASTVSAIESAA